MGDHRAVSYDFRVHRYGFPGGGSIPESAVVGRAFIKIWPVSQLGLLHVPSTFPQSQLTTSAPGSPRGWRPAAGRTPAARPQPVSPVPSSALGFAGAVPLTLLQRTARRR